jgi:flagellar L-ring protein precursor FlgH
LFCFSANTLAESLWNQGTESLYGLAKSNRVGDVITIYISESSTAKQEADTNTSKESKFGGTFTDSWSQVAQVLGTDESMRKNQNLNIGGQDKYQGGGKTTRASMVKAVITAVVTEVLENGNLYIVGEHKVKVNDETETIYISGIVRPADIGQDNSVNSFQIAKAEVSVKGSGVVGAKQTPGLLTKMFNWLF